MPELFAISAYETSAQDFFTTLLAHGTDLVLDVRLKNTNQLCGFTKAHDLEYLVPQIAGARYVHDLRFAPTPELLERYLKHWIDFEEYARSYDELMEERGAAEAFDHEYGTCRSVALLGTATKKRRSHAEALLSLLEQEKGSKS